MKKIYLTLLFLSGISFGQSTLKDTTNTHGERIDTATERQAFREALELWTDDSPTFLDGTYTGDLTVDTNTLHVDSANNRVGINTTSPTYALDVRGDLFLQDTSPIFDFKALLDNNTAMRHFSNSTLKGINGYFATDDAFKISHSESGTSLNDDQLVIKEGQIGIGEAAPDYPLHLKGTGTSNSVAFGVHASDDTPRFEILDNGTWQSKNSGGTIKATYDPTQYGGAGLLNLVGGRLWCSNILVPSGAMAFGTGGSNTNDISFNSNGAVAFKIEGTTGDLEIGTTNSITFADNSGSWDGAALKVDTIDETAGNYDPLLDLSTGYLGRYGPHQISFKSGTLDTYNGITMQPVFDYGNVTLYDYSGTQILDLWSGLTFSGTPTLAGDFSVSGQLEATGQSPNTDNSVMTKGLVRDFSSVWGDVYKSGNGETDTNNKLNMGYAGDRYFNFSCYTGTAAGDGQWTTFQPQSFGLTNGSGAKGQLRDHFSYKFKFDSNATTGTDADLWLIRGKTANATLPAASDVCLALKFAGEEDLMIAVFDGVTAHTTTIDVSTINSNFTNLGSQQEFMWTWDGTTAKVYGRYRKSVGAGPDNDWSIWYTMGSLTPSGMSAGTTNLSFGGLHFLQHTPITNTGYTKTYIIWDLEHTTHVIAPN
jgi:hypothetical protein